MGKVAPSGVLLADANVVIDYVKTDRSILRLVSEHVAPLKLLRQVLATVHGLSRSDCRALRIEVVDPPVELVVQAGTDRPRVSVEDYLCFLVCKSEQWTLATNDRRLIRVCEEGEVRFTRGLRLVLDLVEKRVLSKHRALEVALAVQETNPGHINTEVIAEFQRLLDELPHS